MRKTRATPSSTSAGWARNAFDRNFIDFYTAGTGGNTGLIVAQVGDPRTFGGTVKLVF